MADFVEERGEKEKVATDVDTEKIESMVDASIYGPVDIDAPVVVQYCGVCTMPVEYCEYGACYDKCKEWIEKNMGADVLAAVLESANIDDEVEEDGKKKKKKKAAAPKNKAIASIDDCRVIIARIQRQKRKYVTSVVGLETVPDLKIKEAAKAFGKKFSSGASVCDTATGGKEVVIQGDVQDELAPLLINKFAVPKEKIFFLEDKTLVPYA
jgi:density-regulated protein